MIKLGKRGSWYDRGWSTGLLGSECEPVATSLRKFLSDMESLNGWLAQERDYIEARDGYFSHWGAAGEHFGFVIGRGEFSGQMHVSADGSITMYAERGYEDEILLNTSTAVSDEYGFKIFFKQFRDTIINAAS
jgi:hypothetical protein